MMDPGKSRWTGGDLRRAAEALHGSPVGALVALASRLSVAPEALEAVCEDNDAPIPQDLERQVSILIGQTTPADTSWRRCEWVIGEGMSGGGYSPVFIFHLWPPRFRCRAVMVNEDGLPVDTEGDADILSGMTYAADEGLVLAEFEWTDRPPTGKDLVRLVDRAADCVFEWLEHD